MSAGAARTDPRSETEILHDVLDLLNLHPEVAWAMRMNVGSVVMGDARVVRFGARGVSDIIGQMADGRFLAVEVKSARGRVTADQNAFLGNVAGHHGVALLVRSVDDVFEALGRPESLTVKPGITVTRRMRRTRKRNRWQRLPDGVAGTLMGGGDGE